MKFLHKYPMMSIITLQEMYMEFNGTMSPPHINFCNDGITSSGGVDYHNINTIKFFNDDYMYYEPEGADLKILQRNNTRDYEYFSLIALENNCEFIITISTYAYSYNYLFQHFWYSLDNGVSWTYFDALTDGDMSTTYYDDNNKLRGYITCKLPAINKGQRIYLKSDCEIFSVYPNGSHTVGGQSISDDTSKTAYTTFDATKHYAVAGNLCSLHYLDANQLVDNLRIIPYHAGTSRYGIRMFQDSTNLISAKHLILPHRYYGSNNCNVQIFRSWFENCTNLKYGPVVNMNYFTYPQETYPYYLYNMFSGCSSLKEVTIIWDNNSNVSGYRDSMYHILYNAGVQGAKLKTTSTTDFINTTNLPSNWTVEYLDA